VQLSETGISRGWRTGVALVVVALGANACQKLSDRPKALAGPIVLPSGDIPEGPLSGTIDGKSFAVKTAIYAVDRRLGYEHVDVKLYSTEIEEPCAKNDPGGPTVWLRRRGAEPLVPGTARVAAGEPSPWEVHYQIKEGRAWMGNGDAAASIVIRQVETDAKIHGELSAAFGDASRSLVAGTFVAQRCLISIDAPVRGSPALEQVKSAELAH
jgi:hypothetical protein